MKKQINIEGMSCEHCVKHVTNALNELTNVTNVTVDLAQNHAFIEFIDDISDEAIKEVIDEAGYDVVSIVRM